MPVDVCEAEVFYRRVCGNREIFVLQLGVRHFRGSDFAVDMVHGFPELVREDVPFDGFYRDFLPAVLGALHRELAQDHFGMIFKVAVDRIALVGLCEMDPFGFFQRHAVPFLEKEDVRRDTGIGVAHKSVIGEADRAEQVGPVGEILPD